MGRRVRQGIDLCRSFVRVGLIIDVVSGRSVAENARSALVEVNGSFSWAPSLSRDLLLHLLKRKCVP
jgi:hypothetical protein